jgi:transglutaminase-like putative cysteine protease
MQLRVGYELLYECQQPTPMILMLTVHSSRANDLIVADSLRTQPSFPVRTYFDSFGNWCSRILAPKGQILLTADGIIRDSGRPDVVAVNAQQLPVQDLPEHTLVFLLGSRYCETDLLSETAWKLFEKTPPGWARVQAICNFVHNHIKFGYAYANPTKTAAQVFKEKCGVCRDFTHLAITFCRCMNIPARYCSGYLSDIGMPPPYPSNDFAAWFEVYLGGEWYMFDVRNNQPRIGRVLMTRGRDAADIPISHTFGPNVLKNFKVWCEEIREPYPASY